MSTKINKIINELLNFTTLQTNLSSIKRNIVFCISYDGSYNIEDNFLNLGLEVFKFDPIMTLNNRCTERFHLIGLSILNDESECSSEANYFHIPLDTAIAKFGKGSENIILIIKSINNQYYSIIKSSKSIHKLSTIFLKIDLLTKNKEFFDIIDILSNTHKIIYKYLDTLNDKFPINDSYIIFIRKE